MKQNGLQSVKAPIHLRSKDPAMPKVGGGGIQVGVRRIVAAKHKIEGVMDSHPIFSAGGARYNLPYMP